MRTIEVLLVDDNPADSDLTGEVLASNGRRVHVQAVPDGVAAIEFLRRQGNYAHALLPDFVILDLSLPRKDGFAVLTEVKADPFLWKIPIAVFSTSDRGQDITRSYELGANCYVSKPGNLTDFISAAAMLREFWCGFARLPREEDR
jgi:two-component system, chemotaxis family, response regulator Rcp1